ncbi:hypothetical protein V6N13_066583 [Hibiscus sabdariffa]|uniref:Uncharacterized protein n=1 Tax=Hibiscus sabdariffa TaxID=183260 RepID=A0ABR2DRX1_9ROSI
MFADDSRKFVDLHHATFGRIRPWRTVQIRKHKGGFLAAVEDNKLNDKDKKHDNIVSGAGFEKLPFAR